MKKQTKELLYGDSLAQYLRGLHRFTKEIETQSLASAIDEQTVFERLLIILVIEKWAEYDDYMDPLVDFMNNMPLYVDLLSVDAVKAELKGIGLFLDGLSQRFVHPEAFADGKQTGFEQCVAAAQKIAAHFEAKKQPSEAVVFEEMAQWMQTIVQAQKELLACLPNQKWNDTLTNGVFNILVNATPKQQKRILEALGKAQNPAFVQEHIFDKYLDVLQKVKQQYQAAKENEKEVAIQKIIDIVIEHRP